MTQTVFATAFSYLTSGVCLSGLAIWMGAGETLFMAFAGPGSWQVFIPAAFLVSSVANAGFAVAVFNRRYELMPRENRIVYDNFYTAAPASPRIAGAAPFAEIRLLYLLSTASILLLQLLAVYAARRGQGNAPKSLCNAHRLLLIKNIV